MNKDEEARGGPLWDMLLGETTDMGTVRLIALVAVFTVTGGVIFWAIG